MLAATVEMGKFMQPGRVVLVLAGRYSRCKALTMSNIDDGTLDHPDSHALWLELTDIPEK